MTVTRYPRTLDAATIGNLGDRLRIATHGHAASDTVRALLSAVQSPYVYVELPVQACEGIGWSIDTGTAYVSGFNTRRKARDRARTFVRNFFRGGRIDGYHMHRVPCADARLWLGSAIDGDTLVSDVYAFRVDGGQHNKPHDGDTRALYVFSMRNPEHAPIAYTYTEEPGTGDVTNGGAYRNKRERDDAMRHAMQYWRDQGSTGDGSCCDCGSDNVRVRVSGSAREGYYDVSEHCDECEHVEYVMGIRAGQWHMTQAQYASANDWS